MAGDIKVGLVVTGFLLAIYFGLRMVTHQNITL